MKFVV